jgi:DNA helicase II / ATP-dependent DNA helicase PcrA
MGIKIDGIIHSEDILDSIDCIKVLAGPGAGKTYWLIGQIKHILSDADDLHLSKKIGCITYTNKATENIIKHIGYNNDRLEVSTIHAFLYKNVIKPYFHLIADEEGFDIDKLDGHDDTIITSYSFVSELMKANRMGQLIAKHANKTYKLKQTVEDYRWHLTPNGVELVKSVQYPRIPGIGDKYVIAYKKKAWSEYGVMHHDDVLYFTYKLIVKHPRIVYLLVARFPYLMIDEYQDSTSIQHWFFQKLAEAGCKITLIGDAAQSIYTFAGADIKNLIKFNAPKIKTYKIEDNHRSTKSIVDFLNVLRTDIHQNSLRDDDYGQVHLLCSDVIDAYNKAKGTCGEEELFVLCRKNEDANSLKLGLSVEGKGEDLVDHLSDLDSNPVRSRAVTNCIKAVENARQLLMDDAVKYSAKAFKLKTKNIKNKRKAIDNLNYLLKEYKTYNNSDLKSFVNVLRNIDTTISQVSRGSVLDTYSRSYKDFAKSVNYNDDNLHFITIHKSKGLGFENVVLVFTDKNDALNFLLNTDLGKDDDEHRIYYVACSRARKRLFINCPELTEEEKNALVKRFGDTLEISGG